MTQPDAERKKNKSFPGFFRRRLMPTLAVFERTRRFRLPFTIAGMTAMIAATVYVLAVLTPGFWRLWLIPLFLPAGMLELLVVLGLVRSYYQSVRRKRPPLASTLHMIPINVWEFYKEVLGVFDDIIFRHDTRRLLFAADAIYPTAAFAHPYLYFEPRLKLEHRDVVASGLVGRDVNRFSSWNLFSGFIVVPGEKKPATFRFSWVAAEHLAGFRFNSRYRQLFKGWFFIVQLPRRFHGGEALLLPKEGLGRNWVGQREASGAIDSAYSEFEVSERRFARRFSLFGTSGEAADRMSSPDIVDALVALRRQLREPFALSLGERSCHFAFSAPVEYFTPFPTHPFTDATFFHHLFLATRGVVEISRTLGQRPESRKHGD